MLFKSFMGMIILIFLISSTFAEADNEDLHSIIDKFRMMVKKGNWQQAYKYRKTCPKPDGFEWNYFCSYIDDAVRKKDSDPSQKKKRAEAAKLLKVYDVSLVEFQKAIDLEEDKSDKLRIMMDAAGCAFEAAMSSMGKEDYQEAYRRFDKMYQWGYTWQKEKGKEKRDLVGELIKKQEDAGFRLQFVNKFWEGNSPALALENWQKQARKFLLVTLKFNPSDNQQQQIFRDLQRYSQQLNDESGAEKYAKKIKDKYPNSEIAGESQFALAQFYMKQKEMDRSRDILLGILKAGKKDKWTAMATLGLSEVYSTMKDEEKMVEYLKLAARENPTPTNTNIMDSSNTRQTAIIRLGNYYYSKKNYKEALKYYRKWSTVSFCGTCSSSMENERSLYIARCLIALGKEKEALEKNLYPYLTNNQAESISEDIPNLVISIYEKKGKLDDFIKFIQPYSKQQYNYVAKMALKLAQIRIAKRDGKVGELVKYLGHNKIDITYRLAAANALQEMNGKEFPELMEHCEALVAIPDKTNEDHYRIRYTIEAISKSKSTAAKAYLEELLTKGCASKDFYKTIGAGRSQIQELLRRMSEK